jgi:hypothetical protein
VEAEARRDVTKVDRCKVTGRVSTSGGNQVMQVGGL